MNIRPNISSSAAEAEEVIGNSASSKFSETKEGKTSEGISVQRVDDSKEHEAMEKAASRVSTPDLQDDLHNIQQVSSSGHPHLGVGRELTSIENTLGNLQLQLEHDHIAAPSSVGELHSILEQFENVAVHLKERRAAAAESMD